MIRYNTAFREQVDGKLIARFRLDGEGGLVSGVEEGTKFYFIDLSLHSPAAQEIDQVTYILDQSSYWEPERESTDREHDFTEEITSYGDFLIRVEIKKGENRIVQQALLSDMLEAGHGLNPPAKIQDAIDYIRNN